MDNMQNSTNAIYKIDNSVCTGMLSANLRCNKYVLNKKIEKYDSVACFMFIVKSYIEFAIHNKYYLFY